jgi:shikimate dehydrogenase
LSDVVELGTAGWVRHGEPWQPLDTFYAVLGDPVAHSLSPRMHNAALREREIDAEYVAVRIAAGRLRQLKSGPQGRQLAGFNVTAPLKEAVAALCDGRTEQARDTGAVNTVKIEDGQWLGHNTDSGGIRTVLAQAWPHAVPARAIVLGAGGSARAAVDALLGWGVAQVEIRNRSAAGREKIGRWVAARGWDQAVSVQKLEADPAAPDTPTVWVCCLAAGVAAAPYLPVAAGPDPALLLDLRYGDQIPPGEPPLGFDHLDGLPVLLMQGGLAFAWWFGPPVPWPVMRDALTQV